MTPPDTLANFDAARQIDASVANGHGEIMGRIKHTTVETADVMSDLVETSYSTIPIILMQWGRKLCRLGHIEQGREFTLRAIEHADTDRKPASIYHQAWEVLKRIGYQKDADDVLAKAKDKFPDDKILQSIGVPKTDYTHEIASNIRAARAHLRTGHADDAIAVLEETRTAYGQYMRFHHHGFTYTLADAYVTGKYEEKFNTILPFIHGNHKYAYLQAKLAYLKDDLPKCVNLLTPQLQAQDIPTPAVNAIMSLYLAAQPDNPAMHGAFIQVLGEKRFNQVMRIAKSLRNDPLRTFAEEQGFYTNTEELYKLGGRPVSFTDAQKAGFGPRFKWK